VWIPCKPCARNSIDTCTLYTPEATPLHDLSNSEFVSRCCCRILHSTHRLGRERDQGPLHVNKRTPSPCPVAVCSAEVCSVQFSKAGRSLFQGLFGRKHQEVIHVVTLNKVILLLQSVTSLRSFANHDLARDSMIFSVSVAVDDSHFRPGSQ